MAGARFLECAFTGVSIHGGRFRRSSFTDVWLKDIRLMLSDLAESLGIVVDDGQRIVVDDG